MLEKLCGLLYQGLDDKKDNHMMADSALHISLDERRQCIHIRGALDIRHFAQAQRQLKKAFSTAAEDASIDMGGVMRLDTAGAFLLRQASGKHPNFLHLKPEHRALFDLIARMDTGNAPLPHAASPVWRLVVRIGRGTVGFWRGGAEFINATGHMVVALGKVLRHPSRLRFSSITHHIEAIGINATPIIALIAFVISIVIAYQGQVQLKPLGAERYTVNLVVISVLREMGVLLTAIMVAGRSGSAFTAEIGTMQVREEVDALRAIGLNPFDLLVLPRLLALVIALPLLAVIADAAGLAGGAVISIPLLDISLTQYLEQARHAAVLKDFLVGLVKAPVFAFVIAIVGCMHGLKVSGSAESVGRETTVSVVESIFLVLLIDGLFSIYFQQVGI